MATIWSPFFINNYKMILLIVLNIVLIALLSFLVIYIFKNKKYNIKKCDDECCDCDEKEILKHKQNKKENKESERVFVGRFVTDEEYQQIMKSRRSDISILMEELQKEYEHLKELSK